MALSIGTTNPIIPQGELNRLRGTVQYATFPELNVTSSYLAKAGIGLRRTTAATDTIDTMTGFIVSPAPYQHFEIMIHLLYTQPLANQYEQQFLTDTSVGGVTVRLDVAIGSPSPIYQLSNSVLMNVGDFRIDGTNGEYSVTLHGIYYVNATLWS